MKILLLFIGMISIFTIFPLLKKDIATEGMTNYNKCRGQGFSKEFCVQTPTSVFGPSICQCDDGQLGQYLPGFQGECVCFN